MLFNLLTSFIEHYSFLNVFKYLTFRTGLSVVTSLVVVFIIGGPLIRIFSENMISGPIRQYGPIDHIIKKSGTPTMGGVIIIIGMLTSTLLWADLENTYIWFLLFTINNIFQTFGPCICLFLGSFYIYISTNIKSFSHFL